ncbi:methionyl-tRNA formyltransferase [Alkalibacterium putridalgicola]|uniref:Methionyl-tRNA formyltransferase n=1 Tax=Alkalibacterium putridalgicola TaxID=426703 RepID=A0A1H7Q5B6_9LACT|nr:methionyl-tRNA formyltransferase [Alkalibacterium putridalgicola]GEK88049.1 methionyl-tRNA formyltransferase [Alkalibacterium putridalgicola]SEL42685.1 methionyl-tRNA formyltransferase [Alkalibacterium putridalgicola]
MYKAIFMGTPDFSVPILEALAENSLCEVIGVVTQPDRKVGRKKRLTAPPVKKKALEYDIPVFQPEKLSGSDELKDILNLSPDLVITAAYGQYVPTVLLHTPPFKAINVHASLLPKYRGAAPIHYALINGEPETGVTIMYMEKEMDAGDILSQRSLPIEETDTVGSLFDKLSLLGRDLLMDTLPDLFSGEIVPTKQKESEVTYAPMIKPSEEKVDWEESAETIHNKIRGMNPFPGAYTLLSGQRFKLWKAEPIKRKNEEVPGTIVELNKNECIVACGDDTALSLHEVQPFGKPKMPIRDFLAGALNYLKEGMHFDNE